MQTASIAKRVYRKVADLADKCARRRIRIRTSQKNGSTQRVYFLAPDNDVPSGGNRVIYRHVDILNSVGIEAYALHTKPGFKFSWFTHQTPITDLTTASVNESDILVVPEVDADLLQHLPRGVRHVIFNQNSHLTWRRVSGAITDRWVRCPELLSILTVSEHNRDMVQFAFPGLQVQRIHLGMDPELFHNHQGRGKTDRLHASPRRR